MPMKNSRSKPFVLGISGGSGSGKSTIINEIVELLGPEKIAVLHHDGVAMWSCITCGMCTAVCPQNIEYVDYVLEQRALTTSGASS